MLDKVSIIMPAYNSEKCIKRAIESVINQTYENWELIIVNDGSIDKTLEICCEYKNNSKIKIINKQNEGPSSARNCGIKNSTGKYIMFIDSDDVYEENIVENMINNIEQDKLVCCNCYKIHSSYTENINIQHNIVAKDDELQEFIEKMIKYRLFNTNWNKIYIRDIIVKNNIFFNEEIHFGEDFEFNIDYCKYIKSAKLINIPLYKYYIADTSISFRYRENEFFIRMHNIEKLEQFYKLKNFKEDFLIYKYLEVFIQASALDVRKFKNKNECIKRISHYMEMINEKISCVSIKVQGVENIIIYNLLKNGKIEIIYQYLKCRNLIKKTISKLLHKTYK